MKLLSQAHQCTLSPDLTPSTQLTATTMAPVATRYNCPCFKCNLRPRTQRTIQDHLKKNLEHLKHLRATGAHQDLVDFVEGCQYRITDLLNGISELSKSSKQSEHSYPDLDGEFLLFKL